MDDDFPEVIDHTRVHPRREIITNGEQKLSENHSLPSTTLSCGCSPFPLLAGDRKTALVEPHTIVISETLARKLFSTPGDEARFWRTLQFSTTSKPYRITGSLWHVPKTRTCGSTFSSRTHGCQRVGKRADHSFTAVGFLALLAAQGRAPDYRQVAAKLPAFQPSGTSRAARCRGSVEKCFLHPLTVRATSTRITSTNWRVTGNGTGRCGGLLVVGPANRRIAWMQHSQPGDGAGDGTRQGG
jgi:putative ABC transport system permease protein